MGKILYNDGMIMLVDYGDSHGNRVDEKVVKALLEVETDNTTVYDPSLLGQSCNRSNFNTYAIKEWEWGRYALSKANLQELQRFGVDVRSSGPEGFRLLLPRDESETRYCVQSFPGTVKRIERNADLVQYLAKLYLLSMGDVRHDGVLPETIVIEKELGAVTFVASLPVEFMLSIRNNRIGVESEGVAPITFEVSGIMNKKGSKTFSVPVTASLIEYLAHDEWESVFKTRIITTRIRRVVASLLLSTLLSYQSFNPFTTDRETLKLRRSQTDGLAMALGDCLIEKKVIACPHCGRPILRLRPTSKPFCRPAHQTRYHERAKRMLKGGASVEEVAEEFPYINHETIANW